MSPVGAVWGQFGGEARQVAKNYLQAHPPSDPRRTARARARVRGAPTQLNTKNALSAMIR